MTTTRALVCEAATRRLVTLLVGVICPSLLWSILLAQFGAEFGPGSLLAVSVVLAVAVGSIYSIARDAPEEHCTFYWTILFIIDLLATTVGFVLM